LRDGANVGFGLKIQNHKSLSGKFKIHPVKRGSRHLANVYATGRKPGIGVRGHRVAQFQVQNRKGIQADFWLASIVFS